MKPFSMNVDLPPLSAFTPDPSVARVRITRDTLTLALRRDEAPDVDRPDVMSGTILQDAPAAVGSVLYRAAIAAVQDPVLTITF
jgi:hypothetical protein